MEISIGSLVDTLISKIVIMKILCAQHTPNHSVLGGGGGGEVGIYCFHVI